MFAFQAWVLLRFVILPFVEWVFVGRPLVATASTARTDYESKQYTGPD